MPEKIPDIGAIVYSKVLARFFKPHYKNVAKDVPLSKGVLVDIGTGPGILPIEIAKRKPNLKVIGIDLSEKVIEIANKNKKGVKNVEFRVMDGNEMEFPEESLDFIISTGSLHHWKTPIRVLNEVYRCLKKGGEAWIYDGYAGASKEDIKKNVKKILRIFPPYFFFKRAFRIHGFTEEEYRTKVKEIVGQSDFKTCRLVHRGIMMRIELKK
jgi:ubiquinone/menaquinone biosynthesis C-methylase UbiE